MMTEADRDPTTPRAQPPDADAGGPARLALHMGCGIVTVWVVGACASLAIAMTGNRDTVSPQVGALAFLLALSIALCRSRRWRGIGYGIIITLVAGGVVLGLAA